MNPREYEIMYHLEDEHWWYQAMHGLIFSTLTRFHETQGRPTWRILDGGCGTGAITSQLRQFGQVTAVDLSNLALHFSQQRGLQNQLTQASITALPVPANCFDLVVSIDVMCSVPDDWQALAEFQRVLKPGGLLLLNLPALRWLKGQHDQAVHILHRYTPKRLKKQLVEQGFYIKKMSFANSLLFPLVAPYRLATNWLPTDNNCPRSDVFMPPQLVNNVLAWLMKLESRLIPYFNLPIGMSLFVAAIKE